MYYGWRITAASFTLLFIVVGMVYYGFPVFYAPLIAEFGWTRAQATAGFLYGMLLIGPIAGISTGYLIDRYGARKIMLAGLLAGVAAFSGFAAMQSLAAYYLFFFVQTISYASGGPAPNQVLISRWFRRMRGRALGLAYMGIGVGGTVAPVFAEYVIRHHGWRAAMAALAGGFLLIAIPVAMWVIRDRPSDLGLCPDGDPPPASYTPEAEAPKALGLREAAGTPAFWLILAGGVMNSGAIGGVIQHLQLFLRDQRYDPGAAARVASLLLLASIAGRFVMGFLSDLFHKKSMLISTCLLVGLPIALLYRPDLPGALTGFAILFGFGLGSGHMMLPLITAHYFGLASLGRLMGVILTITAASQAFTPVLVGRLYDLQKSYHWGFAIMAAMALLGATAVSSIPRRPQAE